MITFDAITPLNSTNADSIIWGWTSCIDTLRTFGKITRKGASVGTMATIARIVQSQTLI